MCNSSSYLVIFETFSIFKGSFNSLWYLFGDMWFHPDLLHWSTQSIFSFYLKLFFSYFFFVCSYLSCTLLFFKIPISTYFLQAESFEILYFNRIKEDISHIWKFYLHLCLYLCFFFFYFNPRRGMQIWQLSFDTAGSYCENGQAWAETLLKVSLCRWTTLC